MIMTSQVMFLFDNDNIIIILYYCNIIHNNYYYMCTWYACTDIVDGH